MPQQGDTLMDIPSTRDSVRRARRPVRVAALLIGTALMLGACAVVDQSEIQSMERMLAAAGFQMQFAKTPDQLAKITALPQRTLTRTHGPGGETRLVYADATDCKCLYVGTEAAYARYRALGVQQEISEQKEMLSLDWDAWGGWGPWW
jgi:hypothetical protein